MTKLPQGVPSVFDFNLHQVRVITLDGLPWFVASDVAAALEYRDAANMVRNLDTDEASTHIVSTPTTNQHGSFMIEKSVIIINESGLYSAILRSRKPEAKRFKKWVTNEVLPAIRRTGSYGVTYRIPPGDLAVDGVALEDLRHELCSLRTVALEVCDVLQSLTGNNSAGLVAELRDSASALPRQWNNLKASGGIREPIDLAS
ncbi:hypothetical protein GCM10027202_12320 [Microvirgula curvata]